ncbi:MAG TPA: HAMP domain-containing sensor histidine kinase [Candidatus Limnocylindria bacterium]|nr:HAMP domain-containing sensor histidine kinase [Candidatus Limnocylindria bacterium]
MIDPRTLRGKLAIGYAAALLIALIAFALATVVLVDRTQRESLDDRLATAARALVTLADVHEGKLVPDQDDREQFERIVGARFDGAIYGNAGRLLLGDTDQVPARVRALGTPGGAYRLVTLSGPGGGLRVAVTPIRRNGADLGVALVWSDLDPVTDVNQRIGIAFALAIPLIAAFAVVAGGAVASRGLRPLGALASLASEIEAHDLSRRLGLGVRDDELGRLCTIFDRMLDRLEAAFERQRRFTADASHELRAPLSVIRAEADLMLRRRREPEEYERALRSIAAHADELEALTQDLLAAARAEAGSGNAGEIVDLGLIAREAGERLAPLAAARAIRVQLAVAGDVRARAASEGLRRAAVCVLHNALKFARDGGAVELTVTRENGAALLTIADDGPGFSRDALEHAVERFWRDEHVRANAPGSGLGLAIVKAIVERGGGSVTLRNPPRGGAEVVVRLPAAGHAELVEARADQSPPEGARSS